MAWIIDCKKYSIWLFFSETVKYCHIPPYFTVFYRKIYCNFFTVHDFTKNMGYLSNSRKSQQKVWVLNDSDLEKKVSHLRDFYGRISSGYKMYVLYEKKKTSRMTPNIIAFCT